ncbi:MAG: F0F1 ATP synthase subunit A [Bacilli bacterium]|nr:F0F1 ATP synthase subunit A [Bacilli bacterium]
MFENFFKAEISGEVMSSVIVMMIIAVLAIIIGIQAHFQDPLKKPKGLLLIAEIGVKFFDGFVEGLAGTRIPGFGGVVMCLAVYLFIAFIFGLTGLPSPVTYMAVPLSLGLIALICIHATSVKFTKWKYFKRYVDPFPVFLPINLLSMWAPALSLTLRLFGNAVAGMTLMSLLYAVLKGIGPAFTIEALNKTATVHLGYFITPLVTPVLHAYFDLFSGLIQTTVFISLVTILVGQEIPEEE